MNEEEQFGHERAARSHCKLREVSGREGRETATPLLTHKRLLLLSMSSVSAVFAPHKVRPGKPVGGAELVVKSLERKVHKVAEMST